MVTTIESSGFWEREPLHTYIHKIITTTTTTKIGCPGVDHDDVDGTLVCVCVYDEGHQVITATMKRV